MKQLLYTAFAICMSVFIISCSKDSPSTTAATTKTKKELLTANTWLYDEYFRSYNTTNTVLYYKKDKGNNLLNLSLNRVTYKTDGTYTEITETGATLNGTWTFLNNESQVQVTNTYGTYTSTIMLLDQTHYNWLDQTASNGTYGKLIPQ
jgi:hypothetical protein